MCFYFQKYNLWIIIFLRILTEGIVSEFENGLTLFESISFGVNFNWLKTEKKTETIWKKKKKEKKNFSHFLSEFFFFQIWLIFKHEQLISILSCLWILHKFHLDWAVQRDWRLVYVNQVCTTFWIKTVAQFDFDSLVGVQLRVFWALVGIMCLFVLSNKRLKVFKVFRYRCEFQNKS